MFMSSLINPKHKQVHVPPSTPLHHEEEKNNLLASSESSLKSSKCGGDGDSKQPKNLEHNQTEFITTCTSVTSLGMSPHLAYKKECSVSPKPERLKKTTSGTDTHERGESDEVVKGELKSQKLLSDAVASCDSEKDNTTHRSPPRSKGPTSLITPRSPDCSISVPSGLKLPLSSNQLHQSTSFIPPPSPASTVVSLPTSVSHSTCATKEKELLFLPQQRLAGAGGADEAEKNGHELDKSCSSPGESLHDDQCRTTKNSLSSTIGVTPQPYSGHDSSCLEKVGGGKGEAKVVPTLQKQDSSSTHDDVTTASGDSNNTSNGVMTGAPDIGSSSSQETVVTRDGGSKKLKITGDTVSSTNIPSQSSVGRTRKMVSGKFCCSLCPAVS